MLNHIMKAYKEYGFQKIRGKWCQRKPLGVCPLYALAVFYSKQTKHEKIMAFIEKKWGRPYRNGFTNAVDGLEFDPSCESAENRGFYTKGYEDGEYVRSKLFKSGSEGVQANRSKAL